jgi:Poly-adenylate binding protein, unique domain
MARSVNQLKIARETQTNEDEGIAKILNAVTNVSPEERKRVLGDALSSKVELYQPELVANITDMLLEMMLREMNYLEILSL